LISRAKSWGRVIGILAAAFILGTSALGAFKNARAATTGNCIVTLFGQQYDVTSLQTNHTGGNIFVCGTDMTAAYQAQHGTNVSRMAPYLIAAPTPSPTPTPTLTPSPTPTVTPSPTPTVAPTATPSPSPVIDDDEEEDEEQDEIDGDDDDEDEDDDEDSNGSRGHHNLDQIVEKWQEQISRWTSRSKDKD